MSKERLTYLFDRYMKNACSDSEEKELAMLALASQNDQEVRELLGAYWETIAGEEDMEAAKADQILQQVLHHSAPVIPLVQHRKRFFNGRKWAVAASIVLALGMASYYLFFSKSGKQIEIVKAPELTNDVKAPEANKAMITLADGRKVSLDSMSKGLLAQQGNIKLVKLADGQIAYQSSTGETIKNIQYNTLSNPRGSRVIDMTLADGSRVWLNAGSSLTYPVAFANNQRKVQITGEAYFEVAHDQSKPFLVSKRDMTIQVLGTHFNVNAYDDESDIKITLLEGSVKVSSGSGEGLLKPGQQALVPSDNNSSASLKTVDNINVEEVMAWKNGFFNFEGADLKTAMRQLERWYDITVVYEKGVPPIRFGGDMSKDVSLSEVLDILKDAGVHFHMEGRTLFVMP